MKQLLRVSKTFIVLILLLFAYGAFCPQQAAGIQNTGLTHYDKPSIEILTAAYGLPSAELTWNFDSAAPGNTTITVGHISPLAFTALSVGWEVAPGPYRLEDFEIHIRTRRSPDLYSPWLRFNGPEYPEDAPLGIYWSDLYHTPGEFPHHEFEIKLIVPPGAAVSKLRVSVADTSLPPFQQSYAQVGLRMAQVAPSGLAPSIILREQWWGTLPANQIEAPRWLPVKITVTHAIVHHTASPNNPVNPAQAVRNIWHYHANNRGWGDIGYNFLIDQHGNIYQGRYNPWLPDIDTQAGHAFSANTASIGIGLLGQFHPKVISPEPGEPTPAAIAALERLIAWRFLQLRLNPLESADIPTGQTGSEVVRRVPRISGHRDVDNTSCPGDNLNVHIPSIRTNVAELIKKYGNSTWFPVAGDWNGDGFSTVGLYNQVSGIFYLRNSNDAGPAHISFRYGPVNNNWLPVAGDWDGNGIHTIGLFDPVSATYHLRNSNNAGAAHISFRYGARNAGWLPLVGDWNGNSVHTIGLYQPIQDIFYLRNSNNAGAANLTFRYSPGNAI